MRVKIKKVLSGGMVTKTNKKKDLIQYAKMMKIINRIKGTF